MHDLQTSLAALAAALALLAASLCVPGADLARARHRAWRNRAAAALLVAVFHLMLRAALPDPAERSGFGYRVVLMLGWGHLLGAAAAAWRPLGRAAGARAPHAAGLLAASAGVLFAAYTWAVGASGWVPVALLAVAVWHSAENDLALERAYGAGLRMGAAPRSLDHQLAALGIAAAVIAVAVAAATPADLAALRAGELSARAPNTGARLAGAVCGLLVWVRGRSRGQRVLGAAIAAASALVPGDVRAQLVLGDVFALSTLYHLMSWLILLADRGRLGFRSAKRIPVGRQLVRIHAPALFLCTVLGFGNGEIVSALRFAVFSPAVYLFWSFLHVVQTGWLRGIEHTRARGRERAHSVGNGPPGGATELLGRPRRQKP